MLEGWESTSLYGIPIAGLGHRVWCPKCKGDYPIVEGAKKHFFGNIGTALEGMRTACGATLIASQHTATVDHADEAESGTSGNQASSPASAGECADDYDRFFVLIDSGTGKPLCQRRYAIRLPDGSSLDGTTDEQGHTKLCSANESHVVELIVYEETPPVRPNWDQT